MGNAITRLEVTKENTDYKVVKYDDSDPDSNWLLKGLDADGNCLVVSLLSDFRMDPQNNDQFSRDTGKMVDKVSQFIEESPGVDGKIVLEFLDDDGNLVSIEDTPEAICDHRLSEVLSDVVPDNEVWDGHYLDELRGVMEEISARLRPAPTP